MKYHYNLYSSEEGHFGISHSYHIECDLPIHRFRAIMMEFRRNEEVGKDIEAFVQYLADSFPDSFKLFDFDDTIQFDADQENSAILANITDELEQPL